MGWHAPNIMSERIIINEVSLRDGLQNHPRLIGVDDKLRLIAALIDAGLPAIEVTSFVSPKAVPQMADADELYPRLPKYAEVSYSALVPNARGLVRAQTAGVEEIAVVLSATEMMNQRNINMGLSEALAVSCQTIGNARALGMRGKAYVAVAFVCPFEGETAEDRVIELGDQLLAAGADEIVIADTIGAASPVAVSRLFRRCAERWGAAKLSAHFHDTRALAVANAWAALEAGIRKFDASVGGLGGCPFAPGAAGNVATEDLVVLFEQCGFTTGINLSKLRQAGAIAGELVGHPVGGRSTAWLDASEKRQKDETKRHARQ